MDHAWSWFTLHAGQRMQVINFFLVSLALVIAGFGAAYQADSRPLTLIISAVGTAMSLSFLMLEIRTRALVKIAEQALRVLEEDLSREVRIPAMRFVLLADEPSHKQVSYSTAIRLLMGASIVLLASAFVISLLATGPQHEVCQRAPVSNQTR